MKDKHLSASSASSSNQHALDTRGCKSWYKEENDPWTKRTLVANEGNNLASGDYTTIEGCNCLVLSDILLFSLFYFVETIHPANVFNLHVLRDIFQFAFSFSEPFFWGNTVEDTT